MHVGFVGDVMLGRQVNARYRGTDRPEAIWGDLLSRLRSLDAFVINLECCLSTGGRPWRRTHRPFHFRADPAWAVPALRAAGVDVAVLANNHVMDYEEAAFYDTLDALDEAGIARVGAGATIDDALDPATIPVGDDGLRLGVIAFTDNTPEYAATADGPGTAHITIDHRDETTRERVETALERLRSTDPDLVVASLHWGPNMVEEPPEAFRAFAKGLVDEGVDIVHGHSAHIVQGIEWIDDALVCYDMGDFVDDYRVDPRLRNDLSFLFDVEVDPGGSDPAIEALTLHPVAIENRTVTAADESAAEWLRDRIRTLSEPFDTTFERVDGRLVTRPPRG